MTFAEAYKAAEAHEKARTDAIAARLKWLMDEWAADSIRKNQGLTARQCRVSISHRATGTTQDELRNLHHRPQRQEQNLVWIDYQDKESLEDGRPLLRVLHDEDH